MSPIHNNLHIAYFPSDTECVDILYSNISREDTGSAYGWSGVKKAAVLKGSSVEAGGLSATLYSGIMTSGVYAAQSVSPPLEEEGTSELKGTVWTYNNTGHPADVPIAYIFSGKDLFVRISGLWAGTVSDSRISPIIFDVAIGTYTVSGGNLTLKVGDKEESCPISGSSFTLSERTFSKLAY